MSVTLPKPVNLHVPNERRQVLVESDVFNICGRVQELDSNLRIYVLDPPVQLVNRTYYYSVTEMCSDGVERLVKRFEALDARILDELRYMLHVPFEQRLEYAERMEAEAEAERKENELMEFYERVGRPMWTDLERCGFIQRPVSYPKRGITSGRGSKRA